MTDTNTKTIATLSADISDKVNEFVRGFEPNGRGRYPVTVERPGLAAEVLMLLSTGTSGVAITEKTGCTSSTIARLKSDFRDFLGDWKEEGGKISGGIYMDAAERLSETMERIHTAEAKGDWKAVEALSKSLQAKNKVLEVSHRQSMTARGEASQITREEFTATIEDVRDAAAKARKLLEAEVMDIDCDEK